MALMVLRTCDKVEGGLPNAVRSKMVFNIVLDFMVGLVPFVGDLVDAVFRANTRNALELERHLRDKGAKILKAQGQRPPSVDPTDPDEFDKYERQLGDELPPPYPARPGVQRQESVSPYEAGGRQRGSWFGYGGGGGRTRQTDVEQGHPTTSRQEPVAGTKVKKSRR
ncbi:hypothetical protein ACMFMF_001844 [Clarireedia jacksonii]